ncbi:MAG: type II toxin-antitoxin system Phd/YefM family antitoxin [Sporichthyaceae bacterium]
MSEATIRELRNRGGAVIERVLRGEIVTITRDGEPVAELRPLGRRALSREAFLARFRGLSPLDPEQLRADVDAVIDPRLFGE